MFAESGSSPESPSTASTGLNIFSKNALRRLSSFARCLSRSGGGCRARYRPAGECLESKTLLSDVLGWNGGTGGTPEFADHAREYLTIDAAVHRRGRRRDRGRTARCLGRHHGRTQPRNSIRGLRRDPTRQSLRVQRCNGPASLAHQFSHSGPHALSPSKLDFLGSGIIGTPAIDPATNTIYLVSSESYAAGDVTHYMKTLDAIDMSDGAQLPGKPGSDRRYRLRREQSGQLPRARLFGVEAPAAFVGGCTSTR